MRVFSFFFLLLSFASVSIAYAAGNIDTTDKYAWGNTDGWINFSPTNGNVLVTDSAITGYAWSANGGWINLAPANGGVLNDGQGNLSGFAWDTSNGWISFQGVTIDGNGLFHGQATGVAADGSSNIITFDCTHCHVVTTWRPSTNNSNSTDNTTAANGSTNRHSNARTNTAAQASTTLPASNTQNNNPPSIESPPSEAVPGAYPPKTAKPPQNTVSTVINRAIDYFTPGRQDSVSSSTSLNEACNTATCTKQSNATGTSGSTTDTRIKSPLFTKLQIFGLAFILLLCVAYIVGRRWVGKR